MVKHTDAKCAAYKSVQLLIQYSIKNLSRGSKVYLPVHVAGAKFSVGDLHFSQGDGEISFVSIPSHTFPCMYQSPGRG